MTASHGAKLLLAFAMPLVPIGVAIYPTSGQQAGCRQDNLVPWNCAALFSGSFEWGSILKGGNANVQVNIKEDVTVTIQAGKASCSGTRTEFTRVERESETQVNTRITGPGLVAVEYGTNTTDDPKGPFYSITVACPSPAGEEITTSLRTGERTVTKILAKPPDRFNGSQAHSSYERSGTERDVELRGTTTDENPDADAANGMTGTLTVTWQLTKDKKTAKP
jgi:hypothetical protein